jgi:hypothetical protein
LAVEEQVWASKVSLQVSQWGFLPMALQETAHLFNPYVLVNLSYYADRLWGSAGFWLSEWIDGTLWS